MWPLGIKNGVTLLQYMCLMYLQLSAFVKQTSENGILMNHIKNKSFSRYLTFIDVGMISGLRDAPNYNYYVVVICVRKIFFPDYFDSNEPTDFCETSL